MSIENVEDDISLTAESSVPSIGESEASTSTFRANLETDQYGFAPGGKEYSLKKTGEISVEKLRERESKWLPMLSNWDRWILKKFPLVKKRCRKGIPSSLRGNAWQSLCGSKQLQAENSGLFKSLLTREAESQVVEDIEKDLHRQFPFHEMFCEKGGTGQQDLRDVLYAYAIYNRKDGYCQAQAPVAAVLLMHMPAEEAFWCMVAVFKYYIPGYYSPGLEAVQVDGDVMQALLRHVSSVAYKHLEKHHVSPMLYCTEWLLCIFARTLPWPCVLRLWDMFFCEGIKILFRCALIIMRKALGKSEITKKLPGMYETLEHLKKFDMDDMDPDRLVYNIIELRIDEGELEGEYKRQMKLRKKQNPSAKSIPRKYRYVHNHKKVPSTPSTFKSKKKLNTISANTSHMVEQAMQHEQKLATVRHKKDGIVLTDYRRNQHEIPSLQPLTNGDVASASSQSGTAFFANSTSHSAAS